MEPISLRRARRTLGGTIEDRRLQVWHLSGDAHKVGREFDIRIAAFQEARIRSRCTTGREAVIAVAVRARVGVGGLPRKRHPADLPARTLCAPVDRTEVDISVVDVVITRSDLSRFPQPSIAVMVGPALGRGREFAPTREGCKSKVQRQRRDEVPVSGSWEA